MSTSWSPLGLFSSNTPFALLLLNREVEKPSLLFTLWNAAQFTVTVDGGTTVWQNLLDAYSQQVSKPVPDLITGDFDSAEMSHVENFKGLGSTVAETPDQDQTDFTKALIELEKSHVDGLEAVVAFIEAGGRVDHLMGNFQTLALVPNLAPSLPPVFLCSSHSISWLLRPGKHTIVLPSPAPENCGLIPLDGKALVTTSGLKWNLANQPLRFGDLISTSNSFAEEVKEVFVETDALLLWTMDLPQVFRGQHWNSINDEIN